MILKTRIFFDIIFSSNFPKCEFPKMSELGVGIFLKILDIARKYHWLSKHLIVSGKELTDFIIFPSKFSFFKNGRISQKLCGLWFESVFLKKKIEDSVCVTISEVVLASNY